MTTKVNTSTLAPTAVVAGTYGSATQLPILTVDSTGRVTSATTTTIGGGGAGGSGTTSFARYTTTAQAGQTLITANNFPANTFSYVPGYLQFYMNGLMLPAVDYAATTGNTITLSTSAAGGEIIDVYAYTVASVSNINGGLPGTILYQSANNTTGNTAVGNTGQILTSAGSGKPYWSAQTDIIVGNIVTTANVQTFSLGVGTTPSNVLGEIRATNDITAFFSSDISLKENIKPIEDAVDKVSAIGGKTFDWTNGYVDERGGEDGYFMVKSDFGVIAQHVEAVFPQAVRTRANGIKVVDYAKLSALAFQAIIELNERIEVLEKKAKK